MDENTIRLLLKKQSDSFTARLIAIQTKLEATKGLVQTRHGGGGDQGSAIPRAMRLDVPKFNGANPDSWVFSINEYFALLNTPKDQRLKVVGFNLEGEAAEWFRWMTRNKLITNCDVHGAQYQSEFEKLMNQITDISEALLISFYISGLKPNLQRELLVAKPTTLGEAFSLARVTKARVVDQQSLTTTSTSTATSISLPQQAVSRFSSPKPDASKPPLLPTPTSNSANAPNKPLAIKWISPAERQEHLNKGLCFNCDSKWVRGHKCPRKFLLLITEECDDMGPEVDDAALEAVTLCMQGLAIKVDLYVLPKKGPDVILRIQWLQKLGKVTHDYAQQTMKFTLVNTTYSLKGDESLRMKRISLHHIQALLDTEDVYGVYELHCLSLEAEGIAAAPKGVESTPTELEQLLA
ncbi:hypothetical protein Tco_0898891 [Tanacetum coccineum]